MKEIIVFLDGYEVFKGSAIDFKKGIHSEHLENITDKVLKEGHMVDLQQGDFEFFTIDKFVESGLTKIDMEIRSCERQLKDCDEKFRKEIEEEIEELKKAKLNINTCDTDIQIKTIKTTDYFNMSVEELLKTNVESGWTREECKIYDEGVQVAWYDDIEEMQEDLSNLQRYLDTHDLHIKEILSTINERIVVIIY